MVFMLIKPRWLAPRWLVWLRDNYDWEMIEFMADQTHQDRNWNQRASTQERLEAWAKEMEAKYKEHRHH